MYRPTSFSQLPEVVKNLLIINGLLFFGTLVLNSGMSSILDLNKWLALYPFQSSSFRPYQLITHFFMHADFTHLFFNMFALWMFGKTLENVWGEKRFLIYYTVTALGASIIYLLYITYNLNTINEAISTLQNNPSPALFIEFVKNHIPLEGLSSEYKIAIQNTISEWKKNPTDIRLAETAIQLSKTWANFKQDIPMVGASGAVFGILLAFGMLFPNTLLYIYFAIPVKAKYFVMIYGALELYLGLINNPADNVAHFAHLGGMIFGFLLIKYWKTDRNTFY